MQLEKLIVILNVYLNYMHSYVGLIMFCKFYESSSKCATIISPIYYLTFYSSF